MKGRVHPRVLLVEGKDELRTLPELLEFAGIAWPRGAEPVYIQEYDGVANLLAEGEIEAQFKASGLEALGVLVDADHDPTARWHQVRGRLAKIVDGLPESLPPTGSISKPPSGPRVGVWLMPDNIRTGMLETLLLELRRTDPPLQEHVSTATNQARTLGAPFLMAHQAKAELHTWLAWQDPPGLQLHMGVRSRLLDAEAVKANAFLAWCRELYGL
jgi:hypothetical protein